MDSFTVKAILQAEDNMSRTMQTASASVRDFASKSVNVAQNVGRQMTQMGATVATAGATFGTACIKMASELQATDAQFNQTFGSLSKQATTTLNATASELGMLPGRIKGPFSQATAMFKGLGMSTEEAMQKATTATKMAADSAAFYDISFEEANSALNSFIKGNYEGGEAIGLFANETQMAQYAIQKGLVSSTAEWSKLDEATKQATRLEYAQNMQNLAGVTGQAARESNNWANVMGNLKQSLKEMMAALGQPFLDAFLTQVNDAIKKIQEFTKWIQDNPEKVRQMATALMGAIAGITTFGASLLTVSSTIKLVSSTINVVKTVVSSLSTVFTLASSGATMLGTAFTLMTGPIGIAIAAIVAIISAVIYFYKTNEHVRDAVNAVWTTIKTVFTSVIQSISEMFYSVFGPVIEWFKANQTQIQTVVSTVWNAIKMSISNTIIFITGVIRIGFEAIGMIIKVVMGAIMLVITTVWNTIKTHIQVVVEVIKGIISATMALIKGDWEGTWNAIKTMATNVWNIIKTGVQNWINSVKTIISNVLNAIKTYWSNVWAVIKETASRIWNNIKDVISKTVDGIKQKITNVINSVKDWLSNAWNNIKQTAQTAWNNIKNAISQVLESMKQAVQTAVNAIKNFFRSIGDIVGTMRQIGRNIVNAIKDGIAGAWNGLVSWFKSKLNGLKNMLGFGGGKSLGMPQGRTSTAYSNGRAVAGAYARGLASYSGLVRSGGLFGNIANPILEDISSNFSNLRAKLEDKSSVLVKENSKNADNKPIIFRMDIKGKEFEAISNLIDLQNGQRAKLTQNWSI